MTAIMGLCIALAVLFWLVGFTMLTQATQGVGAVAMAAVLAILARIIQAAGQHAEIMRHLRSRSVEGPDRADARQQDSPTGA
jgi:hypothetical protein